MSSFFDPFSHPFNIPFAKPSRVPLALVGDDDSIAGIVTANDYSVTEGDSVTLTFEDTSISGVVTASDYSVTEGDSVNLEFDAVANTYQWIDEDGNNIADTDTTTVWEASLTEQPPRIRVTNPTSLKSKVFSVDAPIAVAADPGISGLPSLSVLGGWFAAEYDATRKAIPNAASAVALPLVVTRNPRGLFTLGKAPGNGSGGGWLGGGFDGMTVTEKYAANIDAINVATRIEFAATANGLRYRTNPTVAAGTYTMVVYAKSNTGSSQDFLMSRDGGSTTENKTATTSWQRFTLEFTVGGSTALDLRFVNPSTGSGDFLIDNAFLWRGTAASLPASIEWGGHILVGDNDTEAVSCTAGELALTSTQAAYMVFDTIQDGIDFTLYATVKRISAYTTAGAGRQPFFFLPQESSSWGLSGNNLGIGDFDAEGFLTGTFGSPKLARARNQTVFTAGDMPNLFTDGGYHVISMKCKGTGDSDNNTIEVWLDDCILFTTINASAQAAVNWFVAAIGGNNGLARHKVNALACYEKYHTTAETRQSVAALIAKAAESSLTVTKPKNLIIAEGDSITGGPAANSYVQQSFASLTGTGLTIVNWASEAGSMLSAHTTTGLNVTDRLAAFHLPGTPADLTGRRVVYSLLIGANDLSTIGNATTYLASIYAATDQIRALGAKVVICTILPKSSAWPDYISHNSLRATVNAQLRLDVVGGGGANKFDGLADFAADPNIGDDADASGANYSDGLHLTGAAHGTYAAPIWTAAVNALLV